MTQTKSTKSLTEKAKLTLRVGDSIQTFYVPDGASLLEVAAETDAPLNFVCCRAACGECLIRVSAGARNLTPRTADERKLLKILSAASDARLACQCSVLGDVEIEPVDESTFS